MSKSIIVVNKGVRTYTLIPGPNGESRSLPPGGSIEALDEKEAAHLLRYSDIKDINTVSPQTAQRIQASEREIERLKAENAELKELRKDLPEPVIEKPSKAAVVEMEEAPEESKQPKKKKGK